MIDITVPAIGGLIAGGLASAIAVMVLRRRAPVLMARLRGQASTGRVIGIDQNAASKARLRIVFSAAEGREVTYVEQIAVKAKMGAHVGVWYNKKDPDVATSCQPRDLLPELFAFVFVFGVCGITVFLSALYVLFTGNHRIFYGMTGMGFLVLIGSIFLYVAGQSYVKLRSWRRRAVGSGRVKSVKPRSRDSEYSCPVIAYKTIDGRTVEYLDIDLSGYSPGDEVAVYYDPEYPEFTSTAVDKGGQIWQVAFYGVAGLCSLAACGWFVGAYLIGAH
jgi:hypothetical protein